MAACLRRCGNRQRFDMNVPGGAAWPVRTYVTAFLTSAIVVLAIFNQFAPGQFEGWWVALVLLPLIAMNARALKQSAAIIAAVVGAGALLAAVSDRIALDAPLRSAGLLAALLIALSGLSHAAARSRDIQRIAEILVERPAGARYLWISFGAHVLGIFLNLGSVMLIATLLASRRAELLRQGAVVHLTLAMLRGISAMPMCSPLALSSIVILSILPEVPYLDLLPWGLAAALSYILAGFIMSGGLHQRPAPGARVLPTAEETGVLLRLLARIVVLVTAAFSLKTFAGWSLPFSVFIALAGFASAWWMLQRARGAAPGWRQQAARAGEDSVNEIIVVGGAGFLGALLTQIIAMSSGFSGPIPFALAMAITALLPAAFALAGMLAINPIISATALLGFLRPVWPDEALFWLALSAFWGWGVTIGSSPFTANALIAGRVMQLDVWRLTTGDNRRLTLLALVTAGLVCSAGFFFTQYGSVS